jgi:hypothetical protein
MIYAVGDNPSEPGRHQQREKGFSIKLAIINKNCFRYIKKFKK